MHAFCVYIYIYENNMPMCRCIECIPSTLIETESTWRFCLTDGLSVSPSIHPSIHRSIYLSIYPKMPKLPTNPKPPSLRPLCSQLSYLSRPH